VLSGRIEHIEKLGEASLLYLSTAGSQQLLTVKVDGTTRHRDGETVHVTCPAECLHVFDAEGDACHRTPELPA
jgi:ABC-type sugar transport system ATPase subunit